MQGALCLDSNGSHTWADALSSAPIAERLHVLGAIKDTRLFPLWRDKLIFTSSVLSGIHLSVVTILLFSILMECIIK